MFPNIISENSYFNLENSKTCTVFINEFELINDKSILKINFSDTQDYYSGLNEIINRIVELHLPSESYSCKIIVTNSFGVKKLWRFNVLILE